MLSFKHNSNSMKYIAQRHVYVINLKYNSWKTPVDFNGGSKLNLKFKKNPQDSLLNLLLNLWSNSRIVLIVKAHENWNSKPQKVVYTCIASQIPDYMYNESG